MKFIFSTQLGPAMVEFEVMSRYDVENIIRDRAYSQAIAAQALLKGKNLNPNSPMADRTLASVYNTTNETLLD